jgi:hypothetical protein
MRNNTTKRAIWKINAVNSTVSTLKPHSVISEGIEEINNCRRMTSQESIKHARNIRKQKKKKD